MLDANVTAKNSSARVKELGFLCLFILGYEIYLTLFLVALAFIPFRAVHGEHHRSVRVTPWSVHSLHPLEATINQFPFVVFALLWPVGFGMIVLLQVVLMFMTASGHSNYDPFAQIDGLPSAKSFWRFHQRHHHAARRNYGFMGLHWDIVFKTVQPQQLVARSS